MDNKTFIDTLVISGKINTIKSKKIKDGSLNLKEVYERLIKIGCNFNQILLLYNSFVEHNLSNKDTDWMIGYVNFLFTLFHDTYNRENIVCMIETMIDYVFKKNKELEDINGDFYIALYGETLNINDIELRIEDCKDCANLVDVDKNIVYEHIVAIGMNKYNKINVYNTYDNVRKESVYILYFDSKGYYDR